MCLKTVNPDYSVLQSGGIWRAYKLFTYRGADRQKIVTATFWDPVTVGKWHIAVSEPVYHHMLPNNTTDPDGPSYPSGFHAYVYLTDAIKRLIDRQEMAGDSGGIHIREVFLRGYCASGTEDGLNVVVAHEMKVGLVVPTNGRIPNRGGKS